MTASLKSCILKELLKYRICREFFFPRPLQCYPEQYKIEIKVWNGVLIDFDRIWKMHDVANYREANIEWISPNKFILVKKYIPQQNNSRNIVQLLANFPWLL